MGATTSRGRSIPRPFVDGEFTVAWLTFKSDSVEDDCHRPIARKEGILSSKLLRGLCGETTMKRFAAYEEEYISRERFICALVLNYEGNTEDRISFIFTMYSIIYGIERREQEGCINYEDYIALLEYWEIFDTIPKQFYTVFEDSQIPKDGFLLNSQFIQWIRQYPVLMEYLALHLPPSQTGVVNPPAIQTSDEFIANSDALNKSPSCRLDKDKLTSSFDFIGGEDSGEDDSDEASDSDHIPDEYRHSYESEDGMGTCLAPITPSSIHHEGPLTPSQGYDERVRRKRGPVQRGVRNISKTLNGGISKVGRSILHVGKSSSSHHVEGVLSHSNHTPADLPSVSTPPLPPQSDGFSFSSESQISRKYVCGYLQKISDGKWSKRSWHRRWFVLDRQKCILSYYRYNPANLITTTPRGTIVNMHEHLEGEEEQGSDSMDTMLYLNTSHPWYRGEFNLNVDNVFLLFEKSMAKNAPTPFYFQVSTLSLQDIDSMKRNGVQYKLCADNEMEFNRWTHAIAMAINTNKKQEVSFKTVLSHQQLYRQRLLQQEQMKLQQNEENTIQTAMPMKSPTPSAVLAPSASNEKTTDSKPSVPIATTKAIPPTPVDPIATTSAKTTTRMDSINKVPPPFVTYSPSSKHSYPNPSSPKWQLHLHIEGSKQCLIVGFIVNIIILKCIATEHAIIKVFICILVSCVYIFNIYTPPIMRRRHSRLSPDTNIDTNVLTPDFTSIETCLDREHCCIHKSTALETTETCRNERIPSSSTLGIPKFPLSFSMMRTEMNQTGKAGTIPQAWTNTKAESFSIRSRDYKKSKRKEPSQPALFEFLGADLIQTEQKIDFISQYVRVGEEHVNDKLFIINAQLPAYAPSVWAACDGPGYSLLLVWKIPPEVIEELKEPKSKVIRLLKRFLEAGDDTSLTDRFKVIAQVVNQEECGLTGMAKKLLVSHNATPVLTRPQHRIYSFNHGSTEIDIDIHTFSYIARKGIHLLLDKTSKLVIDISFVLQGETEDELPEQILGCCRLDSVDVNRAMSLPR